LFPAINSSDSKNIGASNLRKSQEMGNTAERTTHALAEMNVQEESGSSTANNAEGLPE